MSLSPGEQLEPAKTWLVLSYTEKTSKTFFENSRHTGTYNFKAVGSEKPPQELVLTVRG